MLRKRMMMNCWGCKKQYELNSARAEAERFKSGRAYQDLKEKYDTEHARNLEFKEQLKELRKCKTAERKLKRANETIERQKGIIKQKDEKINALKKEIESLKKPYIEALQRLEKLEKKQDDDKESDDKKPEDFNEAVDPEKLKQEIEDLQNQLKAKEAQLRNNNTNCSLTSSQVTGRGKVPNNREPSGKKPGGQPGHKGHGRKALKPDIFVRLPIPQEIRNNPSAYQKTREIKKRQLQSIKLIVQVVQYEAEVYKRLSDGSKVFARFPHGVVNDINYDASVKAFACMLHSHGNMSYKKVQEVFYELTDGRIKPSTGFLNGLEREFSDKTVTDREHIKERMMRFPYVHADCTTVYKNGKQAAILVCTSPAGTLYYYSEHKGHEAARNSLLLNYAGLVISDGEATFFNYGIDHQGCLEHEERYLKGSMETEVNLTWAGKMRSLLQRIIHLRNQALAHEIKSLDENAVKAIEAEYDAYLELAVKEYAEHPDSIKYYAKGYNTMKRLRDRKQYYLHFLHDLSIPPTNSRAEQKARPAKMHVKQSGGYRDEDGLSIQYYCNTLSLMECTKDRNGSRYRMMLSVFNRKMPEVRESALLEKEAREKRSLTNNA